MLRSYRLQYHCGGWSVAAAVGDMSGTFDGERTLVTLLVPAFNESKIFRRNAEIVEQYVRLHEANYLFELIIVNDGSSDDTGALAEEFARGREELVRVVHHSKNSGLGAALRTGFLHARGEIIIPIDLDLSYSVDHLDRLLAARKESGADLILLSPYMTAGRTSRVPIHRLLFSRTANTILSWAQGRRLHTSTGMVRAYSRKLLEKLSLQSSGMEINLEALLKSILAGAKVKEIPAHLDWEHRSRLCERCFRISPRRLFRQMLLVLRYAWLFRKVRPLVIQKVIV